MELVSSGNFLPLQPFPALITAQSLASTDYTLVGQTGRSV